MLSKPHQQRMFLPSHSSCDPQPDNYTSYSHYHPASEYERYLEATSDILNILQATLHFARPVIATRTSTILVVGTTFALRPYHANTLSNHRE
jgi:hypothetical protein